MSLSDIIDLIKDEKATATVSIQDLAYHVKVHGNELGIKDQNDPDIGQPNPTEIRYTQEMEIVIHKTVGQKPLTQCTIPEGLWEVVMKITFLKGSDGGLSQKLKNIRDLKAGPNKIYTALFDTGLCTYLRRKEIVQTKGTKDWYHTCELSFIEANGGL
jgi:hypothetical protein